MKRDDVVHALQAILRRAPHFYYLFRHATQFGVSTGREGIVVDMHFASGRIDFDHVDDPQRTPCPLWIEMRERDLLRFAAEQAPIPNLRVWTTPGAVPLHPALERMLMRVFTPLHVPSPLGDREDLIYAALFGFREPRAIWQVKQPDLTVLLYEEAWQGSHVYVTSGLSNPGLGPAATEPAEGKPSGFGYELILLTEEPGGVLEQQFVAWTRYVLKTHEHVLRGNWLEYREGAIPDTALGGFLVVPPASFPESFPVGEGLAQWNLLLGVTPEELALAKSTRVMDVAQRVLEAGYRDVTPVLRPSAV